MFRVVTVAAVLVLLATVSHQAFAIPAPETPVDATQTAVLPSTETPLPTAAPTVVPSPSPTAVPTAGPDEIVFYGQVPAAAGTILTLTFFDAHTLQGTVCATAETTEDGQQSVSSFALVVDANCADHLDFPKFCWGENLCFIYFAPGDEFISAGSTIYLGLLSSLAAGDRGPPALGGSGAVGLPNAGSNGDSSGNTELAVILVLIGLAVACSGLAYRLGNGRRS